MISITADIIDNTGHIKEEARHQMEVALEAVGLQGETFAKYECTNLGAVDTGRLRNSITHGVLMDELVAYIGTNVEYAPYVEYGTQKTKAKPFLKNAVNHNTSTYQAILESYLKETE